MDNTARFAHGVATEFKSLDSESESAGMHERSSAPLLLGATLLLVAGCSIHQPYFLLEGDSRTELLVDCTEETASHFERRPPTISSTERSRAIRAASIWAFEHCYAPCEYKMCGSVTKVEQDRVTIYVSYDVAEELPEAEDGYLVIRMGPRS